MNFDKAKNAVKLLLVACVLFCVGSIATAGKGNAPVIFTLVSIACFVLSFVVVSLFCKCPYCGKRIYLGLFKVTHCPHCRRNLVTGARKKGKGGKR